MTAEIPQANLLHEKHNSKLEKGKHEMFFIFQLKYFSRRWKEKFSRKFYCWLKIRKNHRRRRESEKIWEEFLMELTAKKIQFKLFPLSPTFLRACFTVFICESSINSNCGKNWIEYFTLLLRENCLQCYLNVKPQQNSWKNNKTKLKTL